VRCWRSTRAAVALAPPPIGGAAREHPIFHGMRARLARWLGRPLLPSRAQAATLLGVVDSGLLVPEPVEWVEDLVHVETRGLGTGDAPRLVLAAGADACVPVTAVRRLASEIGADFGVQEEATRALPFGPVWEAVVSDVHRWIVRRLGEPLLLLRGDEDLRDE